jgi:hypothetical protein
VTGATLYPPVLRIHPQLGAVDLLSHATEVAIVALCAAHPCGERELGDDASLPDRVADRIIDRAMALLEAVDRYRLLIDDPRSDLAAGGAGLGGRWPAGEGGGLLCGLRHSGTEKVYLSLPRSANS